MMWRAWVMAIAAGAVMVIGPALRAEDAPAQSPAPAGEQDVMKTIVLAAAIAFVTAVSIVGSAMAVGRIGAAALGAAAEKPELLTRSLLFVALAEGLAVLGFVVAMILVSRM